MMLVAFQIVDIAWFLLALGFLIAFCFHKLPLKLPADFEHVFQDLIRYGKTKELITRPGFLRMFDVPKRWFWHFYAVSVFWNGLLLVFSLRTALLGEVFPEFLTGALEFLSGRPTSYWNEIPLTILVLQTLLWVHCIRRLIECLTVSIFSASSIHVVQYAFGLSYYILLGLTVLCMDVSQPINGTMGFFTAPLLGQLRWNHAAGVLLFLWASQLQYRTLALLAGLRTTSSEWRPLPIEFHMGVGLSWSPVLTT
ncbi:polyprenal reductase isoform X2 [Brachyhypopomus gauderio]|uniref:polyprenal reductase isoform X2 n=1 Tax=Brachyhypopomus gauderio TaxID=698409 RepID=UPI0040426724